MLFSNEKHLIWTSESDLINLYVTFSDTEFFSTSMLPFLCEYIQNSSNPNLLNTFVKTRLKNHIRSLYALQKTLRKIFLHLDSCKPFHMNLT